MTEQEKQELIKSITEGLINEKNFGEVIRKIKFNENHIDTNGMTKEEKTVKFFKALVEKDFAVAKSINGTDDASLVPSEFHADVIDRVEKENFALINLCTVMPVSKRAGSIPVVDGGMTVKWGAADGGTHKTDDKTKPTFADLKYTIKNLKAYTLLSEDLLEDTHVSTIYSIIVGLFTEAYIAATNEAIINGTGDSANQPEGVLTAITPGAEMASFDEVIAMPYDVPASKRAGGVYITNAEGVKEMKLAKDQNGRYLWSDGNIIAGTPATFNGFKVMELECVEGIIFGNFKDYYIFDRKQLTSTLNNQGDTSFYEDVIQLKVKARLDGKVANKKSFVHKKWKAVAVLAEAKAKSK